MTLTALQRELSKVGFNLSATLPRTAYDRTVPAPWKCSKVAPYCRSVLVVGNGGRELWSGFQRSPEAAGARDPLDAYTRRVLREIVDGSMRDLEIALDHDRRDSVYLPLRALAERAGLGAPGRIGRLIHREYGPWVSLRAVIYLREVQPWKAPQATDFCADCPAPCALACRGRAVRRKGLDVYRCLSTRRTEPECRSGCDARVACVLGRSHRFSDQEIIQDSASAEPTR